MAAAGAGSGPHSPSLFSRADPLGRSEVVHELERVRHVGEPEPLSDDLPVDEQAARLEVEVGQRPAVAIEPGPCGLVGEADGLPLDQVAEEVGGLVARTAGPACAGRLTRERPRRSGGPWSACRRGARPRYRRRRHARPGPTAHPRRRRGGRRARCSLDALDVEPCVRSTGGWVRHGVFAHPDGRSISSPGSRITWA